MATMNVSLPDPMRAWIAARVDSGYYSNASDYVRDLIRRDQAHQDQREILIRALIAGEDSGVSKRGIDAIWRDMKARHRVDV